MRHLSNFSTNLATYSRRSQYKRLADDKSSDSEESPKSNKAEKSSGHSAANNKIDRRQGKKGVPPVIPRTLKNAPKFTPPAPAEKKSGQASRANKAEPASPTQTLSPNLTLLLKVFGLSEKQAAFLIKGEEGAYFREMLAETLPILVNADGQLQMDANSAWRVIGAIPTTELRFKFLAALDATSLLALIEKMPAWRFHDSVSSWNGPATNDRLAAMMAFDVAYTRVFMDRLTSARHATGAELGPILAELGLLLEAAPIWMVVDCLKRLGKEPRLAEFQADKAFGRCWQAAHENMRNAESKRPSPAVRDFFDEMKLSEEQGLALISRNPRLQEAIDKAQDRRLADLDTTVHGDRLPLFRELVDTAPALAWRYLNSGSARSYLLSHCSGDVASLLMTIDDLSADGVRAEVKALVRSVVTMTKGAGDTSKDKELLLRRLVMWMKVLPASVRSLLMEGLRAEFGSERIAAWIQASRPLAEIWRSAQVTAFFQGMGWPLAAGEVLLEAHPSLSDAIARVNWKADATSFEPTAVFDLFKGLLDHEPALALRYLRSSGTVSVLVSALHVEVKDALKGIGDGPFAGALGEEMARLVRHVVGRAKWYEGAGGAESAQVLVTWLDLLPKAAHADVLRGLTEGLGSQRAESLWEATVLLLSTRSADVVG